MPKPSLSRRRLLLDGPALCAGALSALGARPALAALLPPTPRQTPGPFYPLTLPLDSDNDLVRVAGRPGPAKGIVTHVGGRVLDPDGRPVPDARIEIWQCDANGRYHHVAGDGNDRLPRDENFQGYGRTVSGDDGAYRFRTIRPVPYPGRTPHIHFAIAAPGSERLVTQMYVAGAPGNDRDPVLQGVRDPKARARLIVPLAPAAGLEENALAGVFDIVLGAPA